MKKEKKLSTNIKFAVYFQIVLLLSISFSVSYLINEIDKIEIDKYNEFI